MVIIQFIQPAHNTSERVLPIDFTNTLSVPDNVSKIFKNACNDCHTNNTRYPWYVHTQPIGWIMNSHILTGKENLNFSEFGAYSSRKQANKLRAIETSIEDGSMPLSSYKFMHPNARLSDTDKKLITDWVTIEKDSLTKIKIR